MTSVKDSKGYLVREGKEKSGGPLMRRAKYGINVAIIDKFPIRMEDIGTESLVQ